MPYIPPDSIELRKSVDRLQGEYKNSDRVELIKMIVSFNDVQDGDVLFGACCFGLEFVGMKYKHVSPDKNENYFQLYGSDLYSLLKKNLNITSSNPLDLQQKLVYLTKFRTHIASYLQNPALLSDVDGVIQSLLVRQKNKIDELLSSRPMNSHLMRNFYHIPTEYKSKGGQSLFSYYVGIGKTDPERDQLIKLIELIKNVFDAENPMHYPAMHVYDVIYGVVLHFMERIENQYKLRSPENSDLYLRCQQTLNIKHSKQVSATVRGRSYANLNCFIENYKDTLRWDAKKYGRIDDLLLSIQTGIKKESDEFIYTYLAMVAAAATQHGVRIVIGALSSGVTLGGSVFRMIDLVGRAVKPEYTLFIIMSLPLIYECANSGLVGTVTSKVAPLTYELMKLPVTVTYASAVVLKDFITNSQLFKRDTLSPETTSDWIRALLSLPPHLFLDSDKKKIESIVDLDELEGRAKKEMRLALTS